MKTYEVYLEYRMVRTELIEANSIIEAISIADADVDPDETIIDVIEAPQ